MALFGRKKKTADDAEAKASAMPAKEEKVETKKTTKTPAKKVSAKKETKSEETTPAVKAVKATKEEVSTEKSAYGYRITEKATRLADKNVYVLNVPKNINKTFLKKDLEKKYKVTVLGINIVNTAKKFFKRNTRAGVQSGTKGGGKKAYITLKAGDSIVL